MLCLRGNLRSLPLFHLGQPTHKFIKLRPSRVCAVAAKAPAIRESSCARGAIGVYPDTDGRLAVSAIIVISDSLNRPIGEKEVGVGIVLYLHIVHLEPILQKGELCVRAAGI